MLGTLALARRAHRLCRFEQDAADRTWAEGDSRVAAIRRRRYELGGAAKRLLGVCAVLAWFSFIVGKHLTIGDEVVLCCDLLFYRRRCRAGRSSAIRWRSWANETFSDYRMDQYRAGVSPKGCGALGRRMNGTREGFAGVSSSRLRRSPGAGGGDDASKTAALKCLRAMRQQRRLYGAAASLFRLSRLSSEDAKAAAQHSTWLGMVRNVGRRHVVGIARGVTAAAQ